ncbi:IclR family transcriptional regulator [uncultured Microbacterium sp.]|uniref:IclR family transcriptional regulator n=1 Tax=uncultured Microbacterium sp. TaxID=191216 RepID=UPI0035CAE2BA
MARHSEGESALNRALGVLDAFSVDHPFLTLSEIARRTDRPISTTHRIVRELASQGLLEVLEDRRYRLGNRLWELGTRTPGALGLREIAQPFLIDLHRRLGQHVQLAVRYDVDALVLDRISTPDAVVNATVVGGHMPLPHTALGLVLMAFGPEGLVEEVVERGLRPPTPAAPQTAEQLQEAVDLTRRRGYAVADGYIFGGSRGIAVPVSGAHEVVVAALGMVVPNDATATRPIASALRRTAAGIGNTLARAYLPAGHPDALPGGASRYLVRSSASSMRFLGQRRR